MSSHKGYSRSSGYKATKADLGPMKSKALKKKGMSKETMEHIKSGNLGAFMKSHYPKN